MTTKWTTIFIDDRQPDPIRMALTVDHQEAGMAFTIAAQALTEAGQFPKRYTEIFLVPHHAWDDIVGVYKTVGVVNVFKHPY